MISLNWTNRRKHSSTRMMTGSVEEDYSDYDYWGLLVDDLVYPLTGGAIL
jgi:hypothetical protein